MTLIFDVVKFVSKNNPLASIINVNDDQPIYRFKPIGEAENGDISFCSYTDDKAIQLINESNASLIICSIDLQNKNLETNSTLIFVKNPRLWFMRCLRKFIHKKIPEGIHKSAIVKSNSIGKNTSIGPHSYVEKDVSIGKNCVIYGGVQVFNGTKIGNNVIIYPSVIIGDASFGPQRNESHILETCQHLGGVNIGNYVAIANGATIISETHNFSETDKFIKDQGITKKPISIEDDVWLGSKVTILGNTRIGKGAVIGAGSVVTKDIPSYAIAYGAPCKVVRNRK